MYFDIKSRHSSCPTPGISPPHPSLWPQAPSDTFSPAIVLCFQACHVFSRWIRVAVCISSTGCLSLFKHFKPLPQHTRPPLPPARTLQVPNCEASPGEPGVWPALPPRPSSLPAAHSAVTSVALFPSAPSWVAGQCAAAFSAELLRARAAAMGLMELLKESCCFPSRRAGWLSAQGALDDNWAVSK